MGLPEIFPGLDRLRLRVLTTGNHLDAIMLGIATQRVPMVVRWPGVIKPGTTINDIFSQEDWMPTLLAAAGVPDVKEKLAQG
jgi:hypothetical protein